MKEVIFGFLFLVAVWCIFAAFQWPNGSVRVFALMEVDEPESNKPTYLGLGKRTYSRNKGYVTDTTSSQS